MYRGSGSASMCRRVVARQAWHDVYDLAGGGGGRSLRQERHRKLCGIDGGGAWRGPLTTPPWFGPLTSSVVGASGKLTKTTRSGSRPKPPSKAERLTKALKTCRTKCKGNSKTLKHKRTRCETQAKAKYAPKHKQA
jgi:hypothetical protein